LAGQVAQYRVARYWRVSRSVPCRSRGAGKNKLWFPTQGKVGCSPASGLAVAIVVVSPAGTESNIGGYGCDYCGTQTV